MDTLNLHLTGDLHAITAANNLLAAGIDARMFHEASQKDEALFRRLCPPAKDGSRSFAPVMLRRLNKLGLQTTDPNDLTPEQITKSVIILAPHVQLALAEGPPLWTCTSSTSSCRSTSPSWQTNVEMRSGWNVGIQWFMSAVWHAFRLCAFVSQVCASRHWSGDPDLEEGRGHQRPLPAGHHHGAGAGREGHDQGDRLQHHSLQWNHGGGHSDSSDLLWCLSQSLRVSIAKLCSCEPSWSFALPAGWCQCCTQVLALTTSLKDMRERLGNMVIGSSKAGVSFPSTRFLTRPETLDNKP